tara:strand:- start:243 stop:1232 length:990 start_codon:yes stop_codon:yes gene_type:complete
MTDIKKLPWYGKAKNPMPKFEGDILLGDRVETPCGYIVHRVEFRDLEHMRTMIDRELPLDEWLKRRRDPSDYEQWMYDGSSRQETQEIWDKGIAPSESARQTYIDMRDRIEASFIAADVSRCRAARRRRVRSWTGGVANGERYRDAMLSGIPAPVFDTLSRRADRPVVRIGLNTSMSCDMSGSDFARVAAMAACMSDKFETLGYGVEIVSISCGLYSGRSYSCTPSGEPCDPWDSVWATPIVPIKRQDEPLDAERVLSMGQAGTLRDLAFRARYLCLGIGTSCSVPDLPEEVVEACKCDVVLEHKFTRGNPDQMADRIVGKIQEIVGTD